MARCAVTIVGNEMGILLNNPAGMKDEGKKGIKKVQYCVEEEAAKTLYWTTDHSSIAFPSRNILSGLIQACTGFKVPSNKKMALSPIIAGDVTIVEEMVPFGTKEYEILTCRAVVQRQGILRSRARLRNWKLSFTVEWDTQFLPAGKDFTEGVLRNLLDTLGGRIGIGDYRPVKKGPFGKFKVASIELL